MLEFSPLCLKRLNKNNTLKLILDNSDSIHLDIIDWDFAKNEGFSVTEINEFVSDKPKHVHIMSWDPLKHIKELTNVDSISFHCDVADCQNIIRAIKDKDIKVGLVVSPSTPIEEVFKYVPEIDRVVIMAVQPGFSAQEYLPATSQKIVSIRNIFPSLEIVVDGGMNNKTIREVKLLGANSFVVCSVIAKSKNVVEKISELKSSYSE